MLYSFSIVCVVGLLQTSGAPLVTFATIARGQHSGIEEAREAVVRSASEWKAVWKEHAPGQPAPAVDLNRSTVAGVFLGSRPTGGYAVEITAVERDGDDVIVVYRETKPDPNAMVTQVLSSPYHLVRFERVSGQVRFRRAG